MFTYIVIDDEKLIRQGTIKKLSSMEDTVSCVGEADNGKAGIELIGKIHPDIVILDMQMPVMGGTELLPFLSEHYPDMPIVVISGYDNFEYMRNAIQVQAVDYVLKPFKREDIQKAMQSAIDKITSKEKLESQIITNQEQKEQALYEYDMQILKNLVFGYHTAAKSVSSERLSYINNTHNLYLITLYTKTVFPESIAQEFVEISGLRDLVVVFSSEENQRLGLFIMFISEQTVTSTLRTVQKTAEDICGFLKQQNVPTIAGISAEHKDISELHEAFSECSEALDMQSSGTSTDTCLLYRDDEKMAHPEWIREDEFMFRIESGDVDAVNSLMDDLFEFYKTAPECTLGAIKYHCYRLSGLCRNILSYYFKQDIKESSTSMQNVVRMLFSQDEVREYYRNFFMNICALLSPKSVYLSDDPVEKLKIYVERNYQKELSFEFLSSLFYMNRSYLSHLFKQKTGENFVDYVNDVRIRKAKELLSTTECKMYQIAKAVGYDNIKYFYRIFKKNTGMTPVQYQEEVINS